jgi:hypothetical protein
MHRVENRPGVFKAPEESLAHIVFIVFFRPLIA